MSKKNFILHDSFNNALSKQEFELAKKSYLDLIEQNKYAIKKADSIYELITNIKRAPEKIGPYQNISFFEALNRIGSDLVLLSGATYLFDGGLKDINPKCIHLRMGTTHGFDFEVNTKDGKIIYGEAFNAAESFCKQKMRQAIHKLIEHNEQEAVIFVNKEVKKTIEAYNNTRERNSTIIIHRVYCEDMF